MLVANTNMSRFYNPQTITETLNKRFITMCEEIKLNKNGLIPCPGTMQGGVMVKFL